MATTSVSEAPMRGGLYGLLRLLRAASRPSRLALGVAPLAVFATVASYAIATGLVPYTPTPSVLVALLLLDLTLGLSLGGLIAWRLARLWSERRSGRAGARLHVRLVRTFIAIAVVPAILVAIFAAVTLDLGVETWFSTHVKTAIDGALNVASRYMKESGRSIVGDAGYIADGIQLDPSLRDRDGHIDNVRMFKKLEMLTRARNLPAVFVVDSHGTLLGSTAKFRLTYGPAFKPSASDILDAAQGHVVVDGDPETGIIHALIQLQALNDAYALVLRHVDPQVFAYYQRTKVAATEYRRLEQNRSEIEIIFAALYAVVSLVLLLAAVWAGLWAANRLVRPISSLIGAAERVSGGDLKAQVPIDRDDDEIATLAHSFNRMTAELDAQRSALVEASHQIDARRRFMETVLAGVSAGVLGLDGEGKVTIVNRAAARLLHASQAELEGKPFAEAVPEFATLIDEATREHKGRVGGEVTIKRGGNPRALSVQVTSERGADASGYVVTFDDITELVSAQRTAAWADVARRIAHEIKNPLTPIQLSAERLKRKYASEVATDKDVFEQCTDTIIRQVGDIGRMVDEFSSFARMPTPVMRREIAQELVQQAVFLQRVSHPQVAFETRMPKQPFAFDCDGRLLSQALTNVLKNATESIGARIAKGDPAPGRIVIELEDANGFVSFRISDNGIGLPPEERHRLTEPYVTTRAKGTGLGLAIVRKIIEDHGGEISLADSGNGQQGAVVTLKFPLKQKTAKSKGAGDEQARLAHSV
jgi:two-component system nitrogen regulation sensor histidine kinase NtrY